MAGITLPWISCIIPTYGVDGILLTRECLKSIRETHAHLKPQLIVVDDGSGPLVVETLREVCVSYGAELLASDINRGFAKTCNAGLRRANGMACMLVNNDVTFFDGCPALQLMADALETIQSGVVGIRLLYPDNSIQHGGVLFVPAKDQPIPGYFDHAFRFQPKDTPGAVTIRNSLVSGACFGIHRNTINVLGLLDERYGMAAEDIDYCLDAFQAGFTPVYMGYAYACHAEGATRGRTLEEKERLNPEAWRIEQQGLLKFFSKWQGLDWSAFMEAKGPIQ